MPHDDRWAESRVRVVSARLESIDRLFAFGTDLLLVTTSGFVKRGIVERLQKALRTRTIHVLDSIRPNPDIVALEQCAAWAKGMRIDAVIAVGGGSVIDAAKVLALALAHPKRPPLQHVLEHPDQFTWRCRLPLVAIPTTAGTGAEVTPFATVWDKVNARKHSLADPLVLPDLALLDASLLESLPQAEVRWSGLDTLSHALESLWNRNATPQSRERAFSSLGLSIEAFPVLLNRSCEESRTDMQTASTLAGLAIAETRTCLAHSISYPMTIRHGVPHGLACSFTLLPILRRNLDALAANDRERNILSGTQALLESVNFRKLLREYLDLDQLLPLRAEMITPGRAGNYTGADLPALEDLLAESFAAG